MRRFYLTTEPPAQTYPQTALPACPCSPPPFARLPPRSPQPKGSRPARPYRCAPSRATPAASRAGPPPAGRRTLHEHVERGLAGAVKLPEPAIVGDTGKLGRHRRDDAARGHERFEDFDSAHRPKRVRQHQAGELSLIHGGWRAPVRLADPGIDEQNVEPSPGQPGAKRAHASRIGNIGGLDFEAVRVLARQRLQLRGSAPLRGDDVPAAPAPFLREAQPKAA